MADVTVVPVGPDALTIVSNGRRLKVQRPPSDQPSAPPAPPPAGPPPTGSSGTTTPPDSHAGPAGPLIPKPRPILYYVLTAPGLPEIPPLQHFSEVRLDSFGDLPGLTRHLREIRAAMDPGTDYTIVLYCRTAEIPLEHVVDAFAGFDDKVHVTIYVG